MKYTFIEQHQAEFKISSMCRVLKVHRSGYYVWKVTPLSQRSLEDARLLIEIKRSYDDSYGIYGRPRIHRDLREAGYRCGVKRVARLMSEAKIKSARGYKRPRHLSGKPAQTAPIRLAQQFTMQKPDAAWVTDITYIRTYEG